LDLLTPTLQEQTPLQTRGVGLPWLPDNQLYVAFFGGVIPVAIIAILNGPRLGMRADRQQMMIAVSVVGFVSTVALMVLFVVVQPDISIHPRTVGRRIQQLCGLLTWLALAKLQAPAERRYDVRVDEEQYASLWGPGLAAVFGGGLLGGLMTLGSFRAALFVLGIDPEAPIGE